MKKIAIILTILISLSCSMCLAGELSSAPSSIRTPNDMVRWLSSEFSYQMSVPDNPQTPQEMIAAKKGDCDDFAALASAILSGMGIDNEVYIIKYKGLSVQHAVCAWKDANGNYCLLSNQTVYYSRESEITAAIGKIYPDWEKLILSNEERASLKIIEHSGLNG